MADADIYTYVRGKTKLRVLINNDKAYGDKIMDVYFWPDYPNDNKITLYVFIDDEALRVRYVDLLSGINQNKSRGYGSLIVNTSLLFLQKHFNERGISLDKVSVTGECCHGGNADIKDRKRREHFWRSFGFKFTSIEPDNKNHIPMNCVLSDMNLKLGFTHDGENKVLDLAMFHLNSEKLELNEQELKAVKEFSYTVSDVQQTESLFRYAKKFDDSAYYKSRLVSYVLKAILALVFASIIYKLPAAIRWDVAAPMLIFMGLVYLAFPYHDLYVHRYMPWKKKSENLYKNYRNKRNAIIEAVSKLEKNYNGMLWRLAKVTGVENDDAHLVHYSKQYHYVHDEDIQGYIKSLQEYKTRLESLA